jgi:hypothetical protein
MPRHRQAALDAKGRSETADKIREILSAEAARLARP